MVTSETFYERLDVARDASETAVERAYRERVKQCHPDVSDHPDARERLRRANRARAVLTDATERARYDRLGHAEYCRREQVAGDGTNRNRRERSERRQHERQEDEGTDSTHAAHDDRTAESGRATGAGSDRFDWASRSAGSGASDARGRLGRFALGEATGALTLALLAGGLLSLVAAAAGRTGLGGRSTVVAVVGVWVVVALVAGHLARRWTRALPDDVVRAHAFPLVLLVAGFYAARMGRSDALVGVLTGYGAFAALFRTTALVADPDGSALRSAAVWFVGTAPAALVVYGRYVGPGSAGRTLLTTATEAIPAGLGVEAVVVVPPAAVVVGHAAWRFWRVLG